MHVASIDGDNVYRTSDGQLIGHISDGKIFTSNGKFVSSLHEIGGGEPKLLPSDFKALL